MFVSRTITFAEMEALIDELAKKYKDDHKVDEDTAKQQISQKLTKTKPKSHGTTVHFMFCDYYLSAKLSLLGVIAKAGERATL